MIKKIVTVAIFLIATQVSFAQTFQVGIFVGTSTSDGDIDVNLKTRFSSMRPAIGLLANYRLNDNWLLRGQYIHTKLSASEANHTVAWRQERGFAFTNKLNEISLLAERSLLSLGNIKFYAFSGGTVVFHKPQTDYNLPNPYINDASSPDFQSNVATTSFAVPVGVGAKYNITPKLILGLEASTRYIASDYLDGISELGNPDRKDAYYFVGANLVYEFGFGKKDKLRGFKNGAAECPKF